MEYIGWAGFFLAIGIWWGLGRVGDGLEAIAEALKDEDE